MQSGEKNKSSDHRAWPEVLLVAVPILVIVVTVAFSPPTTKGFVSTITSKPEWYFLALVFCIEAHRDRNRYTNRTDDVGMVVMSIAAVVSGLAAAASVAAAPAYTASPGASARYETLERLLDALQNPLQFFSVPVFCLAAGWSWICKSKVKELETEAEEQQQMLIGMARPSVYSVYKQGAVERFYNLVAHVYNKRNDNSRGIRDAQNRIVEEVRQAVRASNGRPLKVLDIGGGTGYNVYLSLRGEDNLHWTSVDLSSEMTARFRENFQEAHAVTGDCLSLGTCLDQRERFDVITASFALSSMPRNLDFSSLLRVLRPNGVVLITDIHPGYVSRSPFFDIDVEGTRHALQLRKVEPLVMEAEAEAAGFERTTWSLFKNERGEVYSYFVRFDVSPLNEPDGY